VGEVRLAVFLIVKGFKAAPNTVPNIRRLT
jgi:hypothetical protein